MVNPFSDQGSNSCSTNSIKWTWKQIRWLVKGWCFLRLI